MKKININDDHCSMKIGTDAVLIASWIKAMEAESILDIGCGCGIIALMLSQKSKACIHGIDIHEPSIMQAKKNAKLNGLQHRIHFYNASLQKYQPQAVSAYDIIVSNPPFFSNSMKPIKKEKTLSKHDVNLKAHELAYGASCLSHSKSRLFLVLPPAESENFITISAEHNFFLHRKMTIVPKEEKKANRFLMEFRRQKNAEAKTDTLIIRNNDNTYTKEYIEFTKDYLFL